MATTKGRRQAATVGLAAAGALGLVAAIAFGFPLDDWLAAGVARLRALPPVSRAALFAAIFILAATALVPTSGFSFAAGLLFGIPGIPLAWFCMMAVGAVAMPLARHLLARSVEEFIRDRRTLRVLRDVVDEEGWRTVLLVRVSGLVPFGFQSYLLGLTRIRFLPYLLATALGVMPSILVYGGIGAIGREAVTGSDAGPTGWRIALLAAAVAAGAALVVITVRRMRARLREGGASADA